MKGAIKFRIIAFVLAIAGMLALIAWTAHSSWNRTGELRENLTREQLKSFQIADHLQQSIWELNNFVVRYGIYHDTNDWSQFTKASKKIFPASPEKCLLKNHNPPPFSQPPT